MPERPNPYRGHRFPREVIAHAVRLYLRFALSFRDVEELLAERGRADELRAEAELAEASPAA